MSLFVIQNFWLKNIELPVKEYKTFGQSKEFAKLLIRQIPQKTFL